MQGDLKQIKARIQGLQSSLHTTKAMKMEAAAKLKQTQKKSLAGKVYQDTLRQMLEKILDHTEMESFDVVRPKTYETTEEEAEAKELIVVFSTNRGLAGNYNQQLETEMLKIWEKGRKEGKNIVFCPLGKKAENYAQKFEFPTIDLPQFSDSPSLEEALTLSDQLLELWKDPQYKSISVLLMRFYASTRQHVLVEPYLPLAWEKDDKANEEMNKSTPKPEKNDKKKKAADKSTALMGAELRDEVVFEPGLNDIAEDLLEQYLVGLIYQLQIESKASEHMFRMLAMTKASDNAEDMLGQMRILYNRERQWNITQEIIEIINGAQAMEGLE